MRIFQTSNGLLLQTENAQENDFVRKTIGLSILGQSTACILSSFSDQNATIMIRACENRIKKLEKDVEFYEHGLAEAQVSLRLERERYAVEKKDRMESGEEHLEQYNEENPH
jgi:hypothetical protein